MRALFLLSNENVLSFCCCFFCCVLQRLKEKLNRIIWFQKEMVCFLIRRWISWNVLAFIEPTLLAGIVFEKDTVLISTNYMKRNACPIFCFFVERNCSSAMPFWEQFKGECHVETCWDWKTKVNMATHMCQRFAELQPKSVNFTIARVWECCDYIFCADVPLYLPSVGLCQFTHNPRILIARRFT